MSSAPVYLVTLARLFQDGRATPWVVGFANGNPEAEGMSMMTKATAPGRLT
jgi:hypothetical protein